MLFKTKNKGVVQCSIYKNIEQLNIFSPQCSNSSIEHFEQLNNRKELLDYYRTKQSFRVSIGLSKWEDYEIFNQDYNNREILNDEIVIEFDSDDENLTWNAINQTGLNLFKANISFEIWDHGGKSPHLHIHNLPIASLDKDKRAMFKKLFIRNYVPLEFLNCVDISLTTTHMIALEHKNHWKGCYGVKRLIGKFKSKEVKK